ncbi:tumor necrosis factor receptor superfamily member 14 isoform X2 [Castor canadensis]|uniref:Tumor necrosis factor receptor superfamily member 14 isoform X2 n=1 Tax=Castor canadensis TaxID=51338 RepID=A0A8B7V8A2_CASCN|nr:tumor necrosis factor receptor superfamily member 14 isoform X2 [Castor canadensis]
MESLSRWGVSLLEPGAQNNTLRLALCLFLLGYPQCILSQPLCREEEYPVGTECCPKCSPGYHVKQACSEVTGTVCVPCPSEYYTAHPNGLSQCLPCGKCKPEMGLVAWQECSRTQNTACHCSQGHFCVSENEDQCEMCLPHTTCAPGQRVQNRGNHSHDTVCANCPPGTFSPNGTLEQCLPWTRCQMWLQKESEPGTSSTDVTCSLSWSVCLLLAILVICVVVIIVIILWKQRNKTTSRGIMAVFSDQRKRQNEASKSAVTEDLQTREAITIVAVEETSPMFPNR